jgi:hypothetical protein
VETIVLVSITVGVLLVLAGGGMVATGHGPIRAGRGAPPVRPAELLTEFEVSRAVGATVSARCPEPPIGPVRKEAYHPVRGGDRLLQVDVIVGRPARVALRRRSQDGSPLPGVGDEAYSGTGWVAGRRGEVVVILQQYEPALWGVIGGMPWLLGTALGRVPADRVPA